MMNLVADPVNNTNGHYIFNKLFCKALGENPDAHIIILSKEQDHKSGINGTLFGDNILSYILFSIIVYLKISYNLLFKNIDKLYLLAVDNTIFIIAIRFIRHIYKQDIIIIVHNNLESLRINPKNKRVWRDIDAKYNIKFIVLSPFLKKIMKDEYNIINVKAIKHPTYNDIYNTNNFNNLKFYDEKEYDYMFMGAAAFEAKDTGFIDCFLKTIEDSGINRKIKIGLPYNMDAINYLNIDVINYGDKPDFSEYNRLISKSKFVVIPMSRGKRYTASGVLADVLSHSSMIIAPNLPPWNEHAPNVYNEFFYNESNLESVIKRTLSVERDYDIMIKEVHQYSMGFCTTYLNKTLEEI